MVMESIYTMRDTQLITYDEKDGTFCSTEYGDIMSKVRSVSMPTLYAQRFVVLRPPDYGE